MSAPRIPDDRYREAEFDRFVVERREGLQRFVVNLGASLDDAKEFVQEALLRLMRYRHDRPPHEWTPLVYRILLNLFRDHQRRASSHDVSAGLGEFGASEPATAPEDSPEHHAIHRERIALVRRTLLNLPARTREIYLLSRLNGWTYPVIAQHCGISVKAVEKHISRALRDLRHHVESGSSAHGALRR
ncbi:RNA polymerase sigma factor [Dokdonella sp. MW10]|uniref:RNA polymerase sigma factor n=1 Tax=Dokdonella sp. MW10 TaxID=2992926 RepID=UPI003F7D64BB